MDKDIEHTLLDINQNLKDRSMERKAKKKIVFRIWTKEKNKLSFQSEATTLNFFNNKWPKNMCPYCEAIFGSRNLKKKDNKSWVFECPGCKSTLTVLNE
jgi:transposase-like protein